MCNPTAGFILDELKNPNLWNVDLDNRKFNAVANGWSEFWDCLRARDTEQWGALHKRRITPKIYVGNSKSYFYADQLTLNFKNDDTLRVRLSEHRFGYSNNLTNGVANDALLSPKTFLIKQP